MRGTENKKKKDTISPIHSPDHDHEADRTFQVESPSANDNSVWLAALTPLLPLPVDAGSIPPWGPRPVDLEDVQRLSRLQAYQRRLGQVVCSSGTMQQHASRSALDIALVKIETPRSIPVPDCGSNVRKEEGP